jgi:hypothetical protein
MIYYLRADSACIKFTGYHTKGSQGPALFFFEIVNLQVVFRNELVGMFVVYLPHQILRV